QRAPRPSSLQLVQRFYAENAAGGANRVANRDAAAIRIGGIHRQAEVADNCQRLGGKGFVDFEQGRCPSVEDLSDPGPCARRAPDRCPYTSARRRRARTPPGGQAASGPRRSATSRDAGGDRKSVV